MNRHACTIIYSIYRVNALRTPSRLRAGYSNLLQWRGMYDFSRIKTSRVLPRVFSHSLDVVSKMHIHIIYCHYFTCTISETLFKLITHCFVVSSDVLNFHGHSQCPYINVARLSVLHYATVAHVVNIPGKSMSTG